MEKSNIEDNISVDNQPVDDIPEASTDFNEELSDFSENKVHSFVRLSDKYDDIMSSSYTLILVGIVGIIFMILVWMKIIPLPISSETSWLFNSVMGGVFIIFIIAGIVSFMHAKQVKIEADAEDKLIEELLSWADDNIHAEDIDEDLDTTQPMELLYFNRADKIKDLLMHQFENTDEALIYEYTEQIYQKLYENNED